jgi:hypothetical protein
VATGTGCPVTVLCFIYGLINNAVSGSGWLGSK